MCFGCFLNAVYDVMVLMLSGRLFQSLAPLTLNDLSANAFSGCSWYFEQFLFVVRLHSH